VPPFDSGEVQVFPPLFMDDPAGWLIVEAPSRSSPRVTSPFRVADEMFTPRTGPTLANGRTERVCLLVFDGGRKYDPGASFEIRAQMVDGEGHPWPVGRVQLARAVADADGFRRFVLEVTPKDLPRGEYTFHVRLRDPASGRLSESYQAVRVE